MTTNLEHRLSAFYDSLPYEKRGEFGVLIKDIRDEPAATDAVYPLFSAGGWYAHPEWGIVQVPATAPPGTLRAWEHMVFHKGKDVLNFGPSDAALCEFIPVYGWKTRKAKPASASIISIKPGQIEVSITGVSSPVVYTSSAEMLRELTLCH